MDEKDANNSIEKTCGIVLNKSRAVQTRVDAMLDLIEFGQITGDPRIFNTLKACFDDSEAKLRTCAAAAIGYILVGCYPSLKDTIDYSNLDALVPLLQDEDQEVLIAALMAFIHNEFSNKEAVVPLLSLLKHGSNHVRTLTIHCLGNISDPRAIMPLIHLLSDHSDSEYHIHCGLGTPHYVKTSLFSISDHAATALTCFGKAAILPLREVIDKHTDTRTRHQAQYTSDLIAIEML